jgi:hypothetical protein
MTMIPTTFSQTTYGWSMHHIMGWFHGEKDCSTAVTRLQEVVPHGERGAGCECWYSEFAVVVVTRGPLLRSGLPRHVGLNLNGPILWTARFIVGRPVFDSTGHISANLIAHAPTVLSSGFAYILS